MSTPSQHYLQASRDFKGGKWPAIELSNMAGNVPVNECQNLMELVAKVEIDKAQLELEK